MTLNIDSLAVLLFAASTVGVVHTLAGPDHYLPLAALARARGWTARRTALVAALAGTAHCGAAALLGLAALSVFGRDRVDAWIAFSGKAMGALLVVFGVLLALRSGRSRRAAGDRRAHSMIGLLAVVGPCEWLLPAMAAAAPKFGLLGATAVAAVFALATVAVMTTAVVALHLGTARLAATLSERCRGVAAGLIIAASGAAVLAGF